MKKGKIALLFKDINARFFFSFYRTSEFIIHIAAKEGKCSKGNGRV